MSTKPNDLELEVIYEISQRSQKAQDLIAEKNRMLFDMDRTQTISYKSPSPAPKPKGDIRIVKPQVKETISKEGNEKRKAEVSREYDDRIKDEMLDKAKSSGDYEEYTIELLENMPSKDVSVLTEKGVNGYKQLKEQKGLETREKQFDENKDSLDISMTEKESKKIFNDPDLKQKYPNKEEKEIIHNQDIELDIKMDEDTSSKIFDGYDFNIDDFKDNKKDIDVDKDKTPSPADNFE